MSSNWRKRALVIIPLIIIGIILINSAYKYFSIPLVIIGWAAFDVWAVFEGRKLKKSRLR